MGYSISVKFNNKEEASTMLSFLSHSREKIQSHLEQSSSISDQHLSFNTGDDISNYGPDKDKELYVSTHSSLITPLMFQLYIWMANLSDAKDKNGKSFIVVDQDILPISDIGTMTDEEIKNSRDILSHNGLHFKRKDNSSVIMKTIRYLSGENKRFNEFNNALNELKEEYIKYKKKDTPKVSL